MKHKKRRTVRHVLFACVAFGIFGTIALASLAIDVAAHLWTLALLAAIPAAYGLGVRHGRGPARARQSRLSRRTDPVPGDTQTSAHGGRETHARLAGDSPPDDPWDLMPGPAGDTGEHGEPGAARRALIADSRSGGAIASQPD